jgi:flavin reductase (DIM6/NTAB) family NADH-FMN oxidoreductase RutF
VKRLLSLLVGGQSLRHDAIALRPQEQAPVRAIFRTANDERDVSSLIFPLSLSPLLLGLWRQAGEGNAQPGELVMQDAATGIMVGNISLVPNGTVDVSGGCFDIMRPVQSSASCSPWFDRAWRYALAWRQAQRNAKRPHAFKMTLADLRALNIFYMMPRSVYLVSVSEPNGRNIFPMDLVGPLTGGRFVLALRRTSPSIEAMRSGGRIAVSGVPAESKDVAYALGAHHKDALVDWAALPIPLRRSSRFDIPIPAGALRVRELKVQKCEAVGSHMLFITSIVSDSQTSDEPQLCHMSDTYVRWASSRGHHFRFV